MSLKTFVTKLWAGIKAAFQKISPEMKEALRVGVIVVENIKNFVESPAADFVTQIIQGDFDDVVKQRLREWLPKILVQMKLTQECGQLTEANEIVACAAKTLQQMTGDWMTNDTRKTFLNGLAVLIAQVAADNKLTWDDAQHVMKWYYDNYAKKQLKRPRGLVSHLPKKSKAA